MSAPASWKIRVISSMFSSKRPSVDGFVSIRPAVASLTFARRSSTSMFPRRSVCTGVSSYPAIVTRAGAAPEAPGSRDPVSADGPRAGRGRTSRRRASRREHLGEAFDVVDRAALGEGHEEDVVHAGVVPPQRVAGMDSFGEGLPDDL